MYDSSKQGRDADSQQSPLGVGGYFTVRHQLFLPRFCCHTVSKSHKIFRRRYQSIERQWKSLGYLNHCLWDCHEDQGRQSSTLDIIE
ncbi:hypothetical protein BDD12DRAFT_3515 [Trichophaea hybrida]|nr:hypothetical protein BDD12DRAFT_3515 [Trichophaea hybrida]